MVSLAACEEVAGNKQQHYHCVAPARFRPYLISFKLLIISVKHKLFFLQKQDGKGTIFSHRKRGIFIKIMLADTGDADALRLFIHPRNSRCLRQA